MIIPRRARLGVRLIKYTLLLAAGSCTYATQSAVLTSSIGVMVYAWATFLFVGSALCLLGAVTDWWIGEFIGLVPLGFAFVVLSGVFIASGLKGGGQELVRFVFGLLFLSFVFFLAARWIDVFNRVESSQAVRREQ